MIDKPVPGVKTDARPHPAGEKGAKISLDEVAERAWNARMSPRLRAWVSQVLAKAKVSSGARREKGRAVLAAWREQVPYLADPVLGEFMATPDQILCLDDGGLCIVGSDCDEHAIGLAASMMSIGIPAVIIGSSHRDPTHVPTHVYMAFQDEMGDWVRMDGTIKTPMGQVGSYSREFWVEPGAKAKARGQGDFVGMSEGPGDLQGERIDTIRLRYPGLFVR